MPSPPFDSDLWARLEVMLQPIVDLCDGAVSGFEALARVRAAEGEPAPGALPRNARDAAFQRLLTHAMLHRAATLLGAWSKRAGPATDWRLSVNISWMDLLENGLPQRLGELSDREGFPVSRLSLELSERAAAPDLSLASERLQALQEAGVAVVLDDFGAGASGWRWLSLPLSGVKLDAALSQSVIEPRGALVVAGLVRLARELQLSLVAEGVEDSATAHALRAAGATLGQGFLFARAMAPEAAEAWALRQEAKC